MLFSHFVTLTLAALTTTSSAPERPPAAAIAATADSVDSVDVEPMLLTAEQFKDYVALSKALHEYWEKKAPGAIWRTRIVMRFTQPYFNDPKQKQATVEAANYSTLVKQDTTVASIFKAHHFTPEQWFAARVAIQQVSYLETFIPSTYTTPDPNSVVARNMALLKHAPYEKDMIDVLAIAL